MRVDWLPVPWAGKVGLTFAPGKWQPNAATGAWDRDLAADVSRLSNHYSAEHLACLLEDHELTELRIVGIAQVCEAAGIAFHRHPIADGGIPPDVPQFQRLVASIVQWSEAGENVVIHCKGGLGRAGTVGGCVLRAAGFGGDEALEALREARARVARRRRPSERTSPHFARCSSRHPGPGLLRNKAAPGNLPRPLRLNSNRGAEAQTRTGDTCIFSAVLYRLSYLSASAHRMNLAH